MANEVDPKTWKGDTSTLAKKLESIVHDLGVPLGTAALMKLLEDKGALKVSGESVTLDIELTKKLIASTFSGAEKQKHATRPDRWSVIEERTTQRAEETRIEEKRERAELKAERKRLIAVMKKLIPTAEVKEQQQELRQERAKQRSRMRWTEVVAPLVGCGGCLSKIVLTVILLCAGPAGWLFLIGWWSGGMESAETSRPEFCPKCGKKVTLAMPYCIHCGEGW